MPLTISVLIPTHGRTAQLAEAVQSFLCQDWHGIKECIILNDCPRQFLVCNAPDVRVINIGERIQPLGHKRNMLAAFARREFLAWLDDDDIWLPHHLSTVAGYLRDGNRGSRCSWEYELNGDAYTLRPASPIRTSITRTSAFMETGGFAMLDQGEDMEWHQRTIAAGWWDGEHWQQTDRRAPSVIWRRTTAEGDPHADRHGAAEFDALTAARFDRGEEPEGTVQIRPAWRDNYTAAVRDLYRPTSVSADL